MSNNLLSLGGWYILPPLVTGWIQSTYYTISLRAGTPKPPPGSRLFQRDRNRIHILVILLYLLYTIYEADHNLLQTPDFYTSLQVPHSVSEKSLQSRFRRLTITHHPDKITDAALRPAAEALYVHLKLCRDTLIDPAKRFAYDRFGPESLSWRGKLTIADYTKTGLLNTLIYYTATATVSLLLSLIGHLRSGTLWRFIAIFSLFTLELSITTRPDFPNWLSGVVNPVLEAWTSHHHPPLLPWQFLSLARKVVLAFSIALSQIGPLVSARESLDGEGGVVGGVQVDRLGAVVGAAEVEMGRLMGMEVAPFASSSSPSSAGVGQRGGDSGMQAQQGGGAEVVGMAELKTRMRRWLVDNTVRSNAEVRTAMGRVIERRRGGVPVGAAGAR